MQHWEFRFKVCMVVGVRFFGLRVRIVISGGPDDCHIMIVKWSLIKFSSHTAFRTSGSSISIVSFACAA